MNQNAIQPLVSVIVPTRNRPHFLKEALHSILNQTYRYFEIIVVNDSGEEVSEIINAFKDSRIRYVRHETNKGPSASRNTGLKTAKGTYIAYLDDDDIYYPEHLEMLVNFLEKSGCKVAYSDSYQAFQEKAVNNFVTKRKTLANGYDFDRENFLIKNNIPILTVMHAKECIDEIGVFDERIGVHEDWDLWIRMSRKYDFYHVRQVTAEFRTRESTDSITSKDFPNFLEVMKRIHSKYSCYVSDPKTVTAQKTIVSLLEAKIEQKNYVQMYEMKPAVDGGEALNSKVSVVVTVKNGGGGINTVTERIASQRKIKEIETVIIAGQDCASIEADGENGVKIIRSANEVKSYGKLLNEAVAKCTGDYIVFISHDAEPAGPYWLYNMVRPLRDYPELAATSCRQLVKPGADLFSLWKNRINEESKYFRKDSVCVLSNKAKGVKWTLFDKEIKKRLTLFNGISSCARRRLFDEINFSELKDAEEVFIDFGIKLLEKRKAVGYLISAGVHCPQDQPVSELLKKSYRRTKMLHNYINGLPNFYHINNLGWKEVRENILKLYCLINASMDGVKENGAKAAGEFLDNLTRNINSSCRPEAKKRLSENALDALLIQALGRDDLLLHETGAMKKDNLFMPDFMDRFERLTKYLCTARIPDGGPAEFVTCINKIFAELAGEALGNYYLEAEELNSLSDELKRMDDILERDDLN